MPLFGLIILAFIGALGVYFIFTAFTGGLDHLIKKPFELVPGEQAEKERQVPLFVMLGHTATDLSRAISKGPEDLPERIRRSGYYYPSIEVFYIRRIIFAIFWGIGVFFFVVLIQMGLFPSIIAAVAGAANGFMEPDRRLNGAIKKRITRMSKEMGYSIDLIVMSEKVKSDVKESLRSVSEFGLFGKFCYDIYSSMETGGMMFQPAVEKAALDYPVFPRLKEFIDLLQMKSTGAPIAGALQVQAEAIRNDFEMEVIRIASATEARISMLTSMGGSVAALLPIVIAMVFIAF